MTRPIATLLGLCIALLPPTGARVAGGAPPGADWLRQAAEQAEAVGDPAVRAKLFRRIAYAAAQLGDESAYRRHIARARAAVTAMPAPAASEMAEADSTEWSSIPILIGSKVQAGDLRGAKALAEEHLKRHEGFRGVWMGRIALAEAAAGDFDGAMATVQTMGKHDQAGSLVSVASALAFRGDPRAGRIVDLLGDDGPRGRSDALGAVAQAQARAGRHAEALGTLARMDDERGRARCRAEIARTLAEAGDFEAARATVAALPAVADRDLAYCEIAHIEIGRGRIAGAQSTADLVAGARHRAQLLRAIAEAQARRGQFDAARRTADSIPADESESREAFGMLARAHADAGDYDEAVRIAAGRAEIAWLADIANIALGHDRNVEARQVVARLRRDLPLHPGASQTLGPRLAMLEARLGDPAALDRLIGELDGLLRAERDADRRQQIEAMLFHLAADAGRMDDARRLVRGKSAEQVRILIAWPVALATMWGDLGRAEELTFLLPNPDLRESPVAGLAVAHRARAGAGAAAAWVDHLPTPHDRAAAFLGLAAPTSAR